MRHPEGLVVVGPLTFGCGDRAFFEGSGVVPRAIASSAVAASCNADSRRSSTTAFSAGLTLSIRASSSSVNSREEISLQRSIRAASVADCRSASCMSWPPLSSALTGRVAWTRTPSGSPRSKRLRSAIGVTFAPRLVGRERPPDPHTESEILLYSEPLPAFSSSRRRSRAVTRRGRSGDKRPSSRCDVARPVPRPSAARGGLRWWRGSA